MTKKYKRILIPMRMQPAHIGHVNLIKTASNEAHEIVILLSKADEISKDNPIPVDIRNKILRKCLEDEKISNFQIIHMPTFDDIKDSFEFVKLHGKLDDNTVTLSGNDYVHGVLKERGYPVIHPTDIITTELIDIDSSRLRKMIAGGSNWVQWAASGTLYYMEECKLKDLLLESFKSEDKE